MWASLFYKYCKSVNLFNLLLLTLTVCFYSLGLLCFSQALKFDPVEGGAPQQLAQMMPLVKEIAGYIMFGVGAVHFVFGLLCLDIILIRTRAWY